MSEEIKNVEEVVEEVNPIDEYLKNYKEQKLAEFCVRKDKEIENRKNERQRLLDQISEMKQKVEKYDKTFGDVKELYAEIKKLSVDDYLRLYHMMSDDISGTRTSIATVYSDYNPYITASDCISSIRR